MSSLHQAGLPLDPDLIREGARTREDDAVQAMVLMQQDLPSTAIVIAADLAALGFCATARDLGIEIGRDVSVIGYDGIPEYRYARPADHHRRPDLARSGGQDRRCDQTVRPIQPRWCGMG
ncbi:substrate-binding domain-containing protein [Ruegeria sp. MALMAid1280]|uniref:substrate-binding domain-containing protein n=1 Tax=Ruegeria sp. MALMAid1280 TaxID=3411634 RepID=UPI003B9FDDF3